MKKILLLAALAAFGLNSFAEDDEFVLEKLWTVDVSELVTTNDTRQGVGMNGKFYLNVKGEDPKIVIIDENGLSSETLPGGTNAGINRDDAGNLIVSLATFPGEWSTETPMLRVINPTTKATKDITLNSDCLPSGRCDFLGKAVGDMMIDGQLLLAGANDGTQVCVVTMDEGELDTDNSYKPSFDGLTPSTSTVIHNYGMYALYVTRNANPWIFVSTGDDLIAHQFSLPNKGACNGMEPFIYDEQLFVVYPTVENYQDAFAIAQGEAEAPVATAPATVTANANTFQCNWLNAEVDESLNIVNIYQYYPGKHVTMWRFYNKATDVANVNVAKDEVAKTYVNLMGVESTTPFDGINIVVTTYSDGSKSTTKVIR